MPTSNLASLILSSFAPRLAQSAPKMEVQERTSSPLDSLLAAAYSDSLSPIVVPTGNMATMPELPSTVGMDSLAPGATGVMAAPTSPQLVDTLKSIGQDRGIKGRLEDLAVEQAPLFAMPGAPQPPAAASTRARAARSKAPTLEDIAAFDPDLRGQERTALTALAIGSLLVGVRGGLAAATGASQGFQQGRVNQYTTDANRVIQGNKNRIDLFGKELDAFGKQSQLENNLDMETMRQGGRDADRVSRERVAQQQVEAQLKRLDKQLFYDLEKFKISDKQKQRETVDKLTERFYEMAGGLTDEQQAVFVSLINQRGSEVGVPPMPLPYQPVVGADGRPALDGQGNPVLYPRYGDSPQVMNARTAAANAETSSRLASSMIGDRITKNDLDERRLTLDEEIQREQVQIAKRREEREQSHDNWMRYHDSAKLALERKKAQEGNRPITPQQQGEIMKELALSEKAIADARNTLLKPQVDAFGIPVQDPPAQQQERAAAAESLAQSLREYFDWQASRIGYKREGTRYVPGVQPTQPPPPGGNQPPKGPPTFGPKKKMVGDMSPAELKALPPDQYAAAVAELKRIMAGGK